MNLMAKMLANEQRANQILNKKMGTLKRGGHHHRECNSDTVSQLTEILASTTGSKRAYGKK